MFYITQEIQRKNIRVKTRAIVKIRYSDFLFKVQPVKPSEHCFVWFYEFEWKQFDQNLNT